MSHRQRAKLGRGLGSLSEATASRAISTSHAATLYDIQIVALFLDALFLAVRPDGRKEGVLVVSGISGDGERVLLSVTLGMRESQADWVELGRDVIARKLGAPLLVIGDGAPGLIKPVEQ